jgi:hypothetical protein
LKPIPEDDVRRTFKVFCFVESLGEGLLGSDLLRIGAYSETRRKLFVPILPPKMSRALLEK